MKLAFYVAKTGNIVDRITSIVTWSKYSHVEIVFSDGICFSASPRDKGTRFKTINLNSGHWDIYNINEDIHEESVRQFCYSIEEIPYDYIGAIGSGFSKSWNRKNKLYCSFIIADIFNLDNLNQNPGSLAQILLKDKSILPYKKSKL